MFEDFIEIKYREELRLAGNITDFTSSVKSSGLSFFTKEFIFFELEKKIVTFTPEQLNVFLRGSTILLFNFTTRPKKTVLDYVLGIKESCTTAKFFRATSIFPYYKYYFEAVKNYIEEKDLVIVTKKKVGEIIDEVDSQIHDKLVTDPTAVKTKNFFLQLFRLKYKDDNDINLDSSIPFNFISMFLADKLYTGLLERFSEIKDVNETSEIKLKTIIKIIGGKTIYNDDFIESDETEPEYFESLPEEGEISEEETENTGSEEYEKNADFAGERRKEEEDIEFLKLFGKEELLKICRKMFKNDRVIMYSCFNTLKTFTNWLDASDYLKEYFTKNKISIYDKSVVLFVDILSEYYSKNSS